MPSLKACHSAAVKRRSVRSGRLESVKASPTAGQVFDEGAAVFHFGHEQGFSAATYLNRAGLRVVALPNHAGTGAEHIAAAIVSQLRRDPAADLGTVLAHLATASSTPTTPPAAEPNNGAGEHTMIGVFFCDQVPGWLSLSHSNGDLYLWRRGTRDRLTRTGPTQYTANSYALTVPAADDPIDCFVLDLDRAPGPGAGDGAGCCPATAR